MCFCAFFRGEEGRGRKGKEGEGERGKEGGGGVAGRVGGLDFIDLFTS